MDILDRSGILDRSVCCCLVYPCQAHRLAAGAVTCPYVTAALHRGIGTCSTLGRSNDGCRDYRWAAVSRRSCRPSESMACSITQPPPPHILHRHYPKRTHGQGRRAPWPRSTRTVTDVAACIRNVTSRDPIWHGAVPVLCGCKASGQTAADATLSGRCPAGRLPASAASSRGVTRRALPGQATA